MKYYKLIMAVILTGMMIFELVLNKIDYATFYLGLIILNNQK